jgi:hypothetical protein
VQVQLNDGRVVDDTQIKQKGAVEKVVKGS